MSEYEYTGYPQGTVGQSFWVAALQETAFVHLKVLEGMSHRHGDLVLSRFGINMKRQRERGCLHHTGMICLLAVVKPDTQSEASAVSGIL